MIAGHLPVSRTALNTIDYLTHLCRTDLLTRRAKEGLRVAHAFSLIFVEIDSGTKSNEIGLTRIGPGAGFFLDPLESEVPPA